MMGTLTSGKYVRRESLIMLRAKRRREEEREANRNANYRFERHECQYCGLGFNRSFDLQVHINGHHRDDEPATVDED